MIKCNNISISLKCGKEIAKQLSFVLNDFDRLAIIGEEGNGKTTLLNSFYDKSLIEDYANISGTFSVEKERIGYVKQYLDFSWMNQSTTEFLFLDTISEEIRYELFNEYQQIKKLFTMFQLPIEILDEARKISQLSGGEKLKLQLIKVLLQDIDILILDEPTNDLDLQSLKIIEDFLKKYKIPIIFVSHDEAFTANLATHILHIEQIKRKTTLKTTFEHLSYREYQTKKERNLEQQKRDNYRTKIEKEKKKEILNRQHQQVEDDLNQAVRNPSLGALLAKKMKNVKAQEKKLEKMEIVEYDKPEERIDFIVSYPIRIAKDKKILNLKNQSLQLGDKTLLSSLNFEVYGPKHIGIIGTNGSGKTTLLNFVYSKLVQQCNLRVGYMRQAYFEFIEDLDCEAIAYLQRIVGFDKESKTLVMNSLAAMNFKEFEMFTKIRNLSGGQKAKLCIASLFLSRSEILLLDEPTRNLSVLSNPYIRSLFKEFKGVIISVSHDRYFIKEVMDEIYEIDPKEKKLIPILDKNQIV